MLETMENLSADCGNLTLGHDVERDHIGQTTTLHVLHHNPKIAADEETVHEVDNVLMPAVLHDQNFVDNQVFLWLLFQIHLFDGHAFVGGDLVGLVNTTGGSLTNLVQLSIQLCRIGFRADGIELGDNVRALALPRPLPWSRRRTDAWLLWLLRLLRRERDVLRVHLLSELLLRRRLYLGRRSMVERL